jgi:hypothetical protein
MGSHRTARPLATRPSISKLQVQELPSSVGKRKRITNIRGELRHWKILDEIRRLQSTAPHKLLVLQQIEIEEEARTEIRIGYYMIGVKPGAKGRWVWGQFCPMVPAEDFKLLVREAKRRRWI